jgi:hypothetical protein
MILIPIRETICIAILDHTHESSFDIRVYTRESDIDEAEVDIG